MATICLSKTGVTPKRRLLRDSRKGKKEKPIFPPWLPFLCFNALGGILWATIYGLGGYFLGENIHRLAWPVDTVILVLATLMIIAFFVFAWRHERQLEGRAEQALPEPLEAYY